MQILHFGEQHQRVYGLDEAPAWRSPFTPGFFAAVALSVVLLIGLGAAAFAQDVPPPAAENVFTLKPWTDAIMAWLGWGVTFVAAGAVTLAASLYHSITKRDLEASHRAALKEALTTAAMNLAGRFEGRLGDVTFEIKNEWLAMMYRYAQDTVPDALKVLAPKPDVIDQIAEAKLVEAFATLGKAGPASSPLPLAA